MIWHLADDIIQIVPRIDIIYKRIKLKASEYGIKSF